MEVLPGRDRIVSSSLSKNKKEEEDVTPIGCCFCPKRRSTKSSMEVLPRRDRIVSSSLSKNKKEEENDEIKKNPLWNFINKNA